MDNLERDAAMIEATLKKLFTMQEHGACIKALSIICLREDETIFAVHNISVVELHTMALALKEAAGKLLEAGKSHAN